MNEEAVKYAFDLFVRDGYKGDISKFQKLLATNQEALDYSFTLFERDGYKGGKDKYKVLMGLGETAAPVATTEPTTTEPAKTEVVATTTEPVKTEPAKVEPTVTETAKTEPTTTVATETAPAKTEPVKELSNKQLEAVKAQGIPQREAEMPTADTTKMPPMVVREVKPEVKEEPKKEMPIGENLMPITEKTEVKAVETPSDKMVIKSEKKAEEEPMKVMTEKEKKEWQCPPAEGGCPKNKNVVHDYIYEKYEKDGDKSVMSIVDREGNLARFIDGTGEGNPGILKEYKHSKYNRNDRIFTYSAEEPPKSERFSVYNVPVDGVETSVIYDNKTGVILKDTKDVITSEDGKPIKTWMDVPIMYDEYQTLKAEIDKAKGGTTAPKVSTVPTLEPWQQPQGNMQVKEVTEQPKMEVKEVTKEEPKGIPSYDDLGINPEKDPGSFLDATTDKNIKFEKMSPAELIEKDMFFGRGSNIKLERNKSLRYPDPPGTVFKKEKVGEREVYSSYDKANDKWYIYDENSNKDNWTEVKAGPIKTLLNSKYKENNKIIDSKIDYNSEEENNKISKIKEGILLNKYLPYVMKNYDNLSDGQKEKLKKEMMESRYEEYIYKNIDKDDPNLDFWLDVNAKIINSQRIASNSIDTKEYSSKLIEFPELNKDIKERKIKVFKSIAGDVFYDEKNDIFYHGESDINDLKREKTMVSEGGDGVYKETTNKQYFKIIPKGTPAYDKIKSSLRKYNK